MAAADSGPPSDSAPDLSRDGSTQELELRDGRRLTLAPTGTDEVVEIRDASGLLQLRVRMTPEGPVLEMETVRLSLRASESIDIEAKELNVTAERALGLSSGGDLTLSGNADVRVDANGEVRVTGEIIYLN
jgi:hypothetical protein